DDQPTLPFHEMFTQPLAPLTLTTVTVDPFGAVVMIAKEVSAPSRTLRFAVVTSSVPTAKLPGGTGSGAGSTLGSGSAGGGGGSDAPGGGAGSCLSFSELPDGLPESGSSLGVSGSPPISPLPPVGARFFFGAGSDEPPPPP